ncbi:precorrin-3B synthase [Prauserella shujinwangii]|uniref:Precorrin-3B synthase n=1 Tax=Prauserella shujinwangii TaxID=1453103 RepID=A0A2T0LW14_9PSEU|nr:precorrin-3B synthase [Prauserella shujinwangii]
MGPYPVGVPVPPRTRVDACPGVMATHDAADGPLARIRLPGGVLTRAQALAVASCAEELGDGAIHLTSRANLQLRAVRDEAALVRALSSAGLLPAPEHERVRNILGSPLSGLHGGLADVRPLVGALDRAVCARPELARLPGRFLFALDDGRGDVAGERPDVCWRAVTPGTGALLLDGRDTGLRVAAGRAVAALVEAAVAFEHVRDGAWRVREIDPAPLAAAVRPLAARGTPADLPSSGPPPVGPHGAAVVAAPPFGHVPAAVLRTLAGLCPALVVTPWRTLVLPGTAVPTLAGTGLVTDPAHPAAAVSACAGRPGCARSHADVRGDAHAVLGALPRAVPAHFSGCERRCGRPRGPHADIVAERDGYRVDGVWTPTAELAEQLKGRQ